MAYLWTTQIYMMGFSSFASINAIVMTVFNSITKDELQKFKEELFAELRRPGYKLKNKKEEKERGKAFDVGKFLDISQNTLVHLKRIGTIRFLKIGRTLHSCTTTSSNF